MANRIVLYESGKNPTLAGTVTGQVPTWNNATLEWTAQANSAGTVTSVTLDAGTTGLTISGSGTQTITSSGTFLLAGTLAVANGGTGVSTATANTVFAGPTTGGAAAPAFRALVAADIPTGIPATSITSIPYDLSGEYPGVPTASDEGWHFIAVRACTIKATGSRAYCKTAPSGGNPSIAVAKNGVNFATIDYTSGSQTGTVTITAGLDVSLAAGDRVVVTMPANLFSMDTPFWTFFAIVA